MRRQSWLSLSEKSFNRESRFYLQSRLPARSKTLSNAGSYKKDMASISVLYKSFYLNIEGKISDSQLSRIRDDRIKPETDQLHPKETSCIEVPCHFFNRI